MRGQADPGGEGDGYLVKPSFTPDGSRVTYLNGIRNTHQSVVVTRVAGGKPTLFRVDGYLLASPLSFSPNGRFAVLARFRGERVGSLELWVVATGSGGREVQLTGRPPPRRLSKDTNPDWSSDGLLGRLRAPAREHGVTHARAGVRWARTPAHTRCGARLGPGRGARSRSSVATVSTFTHADGTAA